MRPRERYPFEPPPSRLGRVAAVVLPVLIGLAGSWLGLAVWGRTTAPIGPFDVELRAGFGRGVTEISLPPFGNLTADTHRAPLHLTATMRGVRVRELTELLRERGPDFIVDQVQRDALDRTGSFAVRVLLVTLIGTLGLAALAFRRNLRAVEIAFLTWLIVVGGSEALALATYDTGAFVSPTFSGSLALAPEVIGPVEAARANIDRFREQLGRVVEGAVRAYTSVQQSPLGRAGEIRVLHISDLHDSALGFEFARQVADGFDVDLVLDTGDVTSFGTPIENLILTYVPGFKRPYVFVRGNHDSPTIESTMARIGNVVVLDGREATVGGLTMYGLGHPVFIRDRALGLDPNAFADEARAAGEEVLRDVKALPAPPDIVAVHDDRMAESVAGLVPLVVSGHFHEGRAKVVDGTLYLRIGTTGGAGLTTFTPEGGVPLQAEILYFLPGDAENPARLIAYDVIEQSTETGSLTVTRHLIADELGELSPTPPVSSPVPGSASPQP